MDPVSGFVLPVTVTPALAYNFATVVTPANETLEVTYSATRLAANITSSVTRRLVVVDPCSTEASPLEFTCNTEAKSQCSMNRM